MLYYFLYKLIYQTQCAEGATCESIFYKGLNVFQYVTFRTALATMISLVFTILIGDKVIKKLSDMKFGQEIREELSAEHQAKKGTPTMGGILILASVFVATILCARLDSLYLWLTLISTTLFGLIGFIDDYIKIVKKRSEGLTERQKLAGQLAVSVGVWATLFLFANYPWNLSIPFWKESAISNITFIGSIPYLFFIVFILLGSSNAVNLTDGLDGLAISITFIAT